MADWKVTINIKDARDNYLSGDITLHELAGTVASKLKAALPGPYRDDYQFESIVDELADFHPDDDLESFDYIMDQLYDWADEGHRLWVAT